MALLQMAAVNDSRNLPASRDCFGVSQRRRVAVPYISGDVCLPISISGVKHSSKTMQLRDRSLPCALLLVLIVLSGREVHGVSLRVFVTPVASPVRLHARKCLSIYTISHLSHGFAVSAARQHEGWICTGSALPIICCPALKMILPVADCGKHTDTIG